MKLEKMKIKIAWLYYDLLELYGDRGNIKVLEKILEWNNISFETKKITINDGLDLSNFDILFLGGGSDKAQKILEKDLFSRTEQIKNFINNNGFILGVCGGYQMLGKYYLDSKGNKTKGLGIFDYYTISGKKRSVGNIKVKVDIAGFLENLEITGFENHGGETKNIGGNFLGIVIEGNGNEFQGKCEGFYNHNFIGTYVHGPLLPKNPIIGKKIIEQVLREKYKYDIELILKFSEETKSATKEVLF